MHNNIAIFVPHAGCPFRCSFCNQNTITEQEHLPRAEDVRRICRQAFAEIKHKSQTEIAFFGGSFTAMPEPYMRELLEAAQEFLGEGKFSGIRISTRPDCIDDEILTFLKSYHVTAVELGAQSMCNSVLQANHRGHSVEDVQQASRKIQQHGIELGLQVMTGLYQSSWQNERETGERIRALRPATVRIYPVVVLSNTLLAKYYQSGKYILFPFEEMVQFVSEQMALYHQAGIRVIKCGLHASEFVQKDCLAGYYHPAFRELCENIIYRKKMLALFQESGQTKTIFSVHPNCFSKAIGQKKSNLQYFQETFQKKIQIIGDDDLLLYEVK